MAIDIFDYMPSLADLSLEDVFSNRVKAEELIKEVFPDVDTSPNSVFGNTYLTPAAFFITAMEVAANKLRDDLDLETVFQQGANNEDFVRSFINNFSNFSFLGTKESTGVIRLTLTSDTLLELKEDTQFYFEGYPENTLSINTAQEGDFYALPTYSKLGKYANERHLIYKDENEYTIDIPVKGVVGEQFVAGEPVLTNDDIPNLEGIVTVTEFLPASFAQSDDIYAQIAQLKTTNSDAGILSRKGTSSLIFKLFDVIDRVSVVRSGDKEMLRDGIGTLGIGVNTLDIYIKTNPTLNYEEQSVLCPYFPDNQTFIINLKLPQTPLHIRSVTYTGNPSLNLDYEVVSQSNDKKFPLLSANSSKKEDIWLVIKMPFANGEPQINVVDQDSANFTVDYGYDPKLMEVGSYFESPDNVPSAFSVNVKGFIPLAINNLNITYTPYSGQFFDVAEAKTAIAEYINGLAYPEVFLESAITEIVSFFGGKGVKNIEVKGAIEFGVADAVIAIDDPLPTEDFDGFNNAKRYPETIEINSIKHMEIEVVDGKLGVLGEETFFAVGKRNLTYRIDSSNITFVKG
jgi:hypothetical protein